MIRSLLVPLDGSPFSEHALPLAASIARRAGARLQLVHVFSPRATLSWDLPTWFDETVDTRLKQHQEAYLDQTTERLRNVGRIAVSAEVLQGETAPAIRLHATVSDIDLVVMTTHGRGAMARLWLGSVADQLIRELPMPLLLVRPQEETADLTRDVVLRRLLLPLDGSPFSEQMVSPALDLATVMDAECLLLQVIHLVHPDSYARAEGRFLEGHNPTDIAQSILEQIDEARSELRTQAEAYLETIAQRFRARDLRVASSVVFDDHPAEAILRQATAAGADLIALETHGRRGLVRVFRGSVADKIIRGSTLPVLVRRPAEGS